MKMKRSFEVVSAATITLLWLSPAARVFSQPWTVTGAPLAYWTCVASSADGVKLAATTLLGPIYISADSGVTWTLASAPAEMWVSIVSSADGNKLVAGTGDGQIYASTNSGVSWMLAAALPPGGQPPTATSADGTLLAALGNHSVYISTNSAASWTASSVPTNTYLDAVGVSASGTIMAALGYLYTNGGAVGLVYVSTNSGASWSLACAPTNDYNFSAVAVSADGSTIAALAGFIYISTNSGVSWSVNQVMTNYGGSSGSVAMSADGTKLAVGGAGIYISTNSGSTWVRTGAPSIIPGLMVTSSADGSKLEAYYSIFSIQQYLPGYIYTLQTVPTPRLHMLVSNGNLTFSWVVPSTSFVLQQSCDLTGASWTTVTNLPLLNLANLNDQIILQPPNGGLGFYRLKTP